MVEVAVVADSRLLRDGLALVLERRSDLRLATAVRSPADLVRQHQDMLDVIILDSANAVDAGQIPQMLEAFPKAAVLALEVSEEEKAVPELAELGIRGYLTRDASLDSVLNAIDSVRRDELVCPPRVAACLARRLQTLAATAIARSPVTRLTPRESQVMNLIADGLSNKQIARSLQIELATVKNHVHNILRKLDAQGRVQAVVAMQKERMQLMPDSSTSLNTST